MTSHDTPARVEIPEIAVQLESFGFNGDLYKRIISLGSIHFYSNREIENKSPFFS